MPFGEEAAMLTINAASTGSNSSFYPTWKFYDIFFFFFSFLPNLCIYFLLCCSPGQGVIARPKPSRIAVSPFTFNSRQNKWNRLSFFLGHWVKYDSQASEMLKLKSKATQSAFVPNLLLPPLASFLLRALSHTEEKASLKMPPNGRPLMALCDRSYLWQDSCLSLSVWGDGIQTRSGVLERRRPTADFPEGSSSCVGNKEKSHTKVLDDVPHYH